MLCTTTLYDVKMLYMWCNVYMTTHVMYNDAMWCENAPWFNVCMTHDMHDKVIWCENAIFCATTCMQWCENAILWDNVYSMTLICTMMLCQVKMLYLCENV